MSLNKLNFTKDWTNPADFPTVEMTEEKVRADQQFLFNEIKTFLNDTLIPEIASEITAACQGLVLGQITDGSITKAKLATAVADAVARAEAGGELDKKLAGITLSGLGAVGKTGDTMSGNLTIEKQGPQITWKHANTGRDAYILLGSDDLLYFTNRKDSNNRQGIYIKAETEPLTQAVRLQRVVNGVPYYYDMLHTGNLSDLGVAKIEVGSYVGTGAYGVDNPNSLTFGFVPKVVFISPGNTDSAAAGVIFINGSTTFGGFGTFYTTSGTVTTRSISISWSDKTVSWYTTKDVTTQQNYSGKTYRYVAFG